MQLYRIDGFLASGGGQLPANVDVRGVAIHPSSEVDLVDINGFRLAPCGIVPCAPGATIKSVRNGVGGFAPIGESLVLALYEKCDPLVPLGMRTPVFSKIVGDATLLPGAAVTPALIAVRLPFHGRQHATITFQRSDTANDLSVQALGVRYGIVGDPTAVGGNAGAASQRTASSEEFWWNGAVAAPVDLLGQTCARTVHVGGDESEECFDALFVLVRGAAGAAGTTYTITVEAWGERSQV